MRKTGLFLIAALVLLFSCDRKREGKPRVLLFSKHADFRHASIPAGVTAIQKLGTENGFDVDTTKNAQLFTEENLSQYAAVIFLNTTGDVLNYRQEAAFERYIQAGGGFVGVHAATDTEYDWGWYGRLVGAYFNGHPRPQAARFIIKDRNFPATSFFKDSVWQRTDELYNFRKINPDLRVLITIDESSYEGGTNGAVHPMSWYHDYDGGRAFYTALGHTDETYMEPLYLQHLLGGIQYAIGKNNKPDYSAVRTQSPPDNDRFTKTQLALAGEFYEPTEMTILPNLDVLIAQRRGQILLYKNDTRKVKQAGFLNVYFKSKATGVNVEEGLLGMAKDPHFEKNHWLYIYYSPADTSVNRLSRFTFENDTLINTTEKTILEVKSQREICCHTGGSIAFGPDGLLYVSAGDNSTPFDEPKQRYVNSGYGPLNDTPGHQQYDARRSSSNTNDLRGKIMRIRVNDDATYSIPDGNLFPKGTEKTRPEIYVMGNRNPYRISVDQKTGFLYWGEVGPDASVDSLSTRGPRGYDELNQARKAGYFGWPLFVGNNYPYHQYNYETGESGPTFDPQKPVNDSRNNTGLRELPPVSPAFIWYPYGHSTEFPQVGTGGRNAMAGPVYYTDLFPKETRLPDYYNGKLIIYDWIRGWMKAVTMLPNGDFDKMEPFAQGMKLNSLIDMEVGPDGRLYLLEYGTGWFTKNPDAGLSRIDYNGGNRPPKVSDFKVEKNSGMLPFTVKASVKSRDPENDPITYRWKLGNGETRETSTPSLEFTYSNKGEYWFSVESIDSKGASAKSDSISLYAGNEAPTVKIEIQKGNKSFYVPGLPIQYAVSVSDASETSVDPTRLLVSADYVAGVRTDSMPAGHLQVISGRALMLSLDCKSCHKESEKSIGPAYTDVARKYKERPYAEEYLIKKIISGGSGVWGDVAMAAHPDLSTVDAQIIVRWIFSLDHSADQRKTLPMAGTILPVKQNNNSALLISATYTDKVGPDVKPLTGTAQLVLPGNIININGKEEAKGFRRERNGNTHYLALTQSPSWFRIPNIDLTGVKVAQVRLNWLTAPTDEITFEIRSGSPEGALLGTGTLRPTKTRETRGMVPVTLKASDSIQDLYVVYKPGKNEIRSTTVTGVEFTN